MADLIDGKAFAARLRAAIADQTRRLHRDHDLVPGLAVVRVGEAPASQVCPRKPHPRPSVNHVVPNNNKLG